MAGAGTTNNSGDDAAAAPRLTFSRRWFIGSSVGTVAALALIACDPPITTPNTITGENAQSGSAATDWDIGFDDTIEGFASPYSINAGSRVDFKINTASPSYRIDIFRMGWYGGKGARKITSILPSVPLPQIQPAPFRDNHTGLVDCGTWAVSASWNVPADAVSGVYFANLIRTDGSGRNNRLQFVVRNDGRAADIMFQTSDTTYQAYNEWGGNSLYRGTSDYGRAVKVSYNRPLRPSAMENTFHYAELPLLRWLEANGYDVAYCGDIDIHQNGAQLLDKKVFVSQGHDEYWSGPQRAHVEAARDAGVHLLFLTGNECFWRVRFEPSADGRNDADRTLVCYKETLDDAKTDPSPQWTGTWRDPRFGAPGRPENALTGTLFRAIDPNDHPDFAIEVPYAYARNRLWRNTEISLLAAGQVATLAGGTLGYEWNSDEDNGVRPPGLIRLSETTEVANQVLQDYGGTYITAPLTHHLTCYKAPSGALVFSSGTVQWAWGLDSYHLTNPEVTIPVDQRMRQATVNLLADMDVRAGSLGSGLTAATKSTDTLPPVSTIASPVAGAVLSIGTAVAVNGTAVDSGGGCVAGVEVSVDGGATWHPASGTDTWTYTFIPLAAGPITIKSRGIDDSCNMETAGAGIAVTAGPRPLPCSIWPASTVPKLPSANDADPIEVGVRFRSSTSGFITAIRFYKGTGNTGTHVGHLWSATGVLLGTATFAGETASGWQQANLATAVPVDAGTTYVASYYAPQGHYAADRDYFLQAWQLAPLEAPADNGAAPNGVFRAGSSGFPTTTYGSTNYWVDVVLDSDNHAAPTVVDRAPGAGLEAVSTSGPVTVTFSEAVAPASIILEVRNAGVTVPGSTTYDAPTRTSRFVPTAPFATRTIHTVHVLDVADLLGHHLAAPVTWSFTTAGPAGTYPATLWDTSAAPTTLVANDPNQLELGIRFTSDVDGTVRALRFYKGPQDTGSHVGHLWSAAGALLGSVTFTNETATGWQQAALVPPVAIAKNVTYVASYHSTSGNGCATTGYFTNPRTQVPLRAPVTNGVYRYGPAAFPTATSPDRTNYWVDVVVERSSDAVAPVIADRAPAPAIQAVALATTVVATFDEAINPASLAFTLRGPGNQLVASTTSYDAPTTSATLTPNAPLAPTTLYTASVSATDTAGNAMAAPVTWTFTTASPAGQTPATIWDTAAVPAVTAVPEPASVEVGVKFRADANGAITGLRFYKGPGNGGTHVGHLWTTSGTLLASAAFTNETATGWQQANFASPVPVSANTTYVASYHAPDGGYAITSGGLGAATDRAPLHALASGASGGNGVFAYGAGSFPAGSFNASNYWVDVVFVDQHAPSVDDRFPAPGATEVEATTLVEATFSEPVQAVTVSFVLRDAQNVVVPASTSYDSAAQRTALTPNAALAPLATYTATVSGARDAQGNQMAPTTWSFTTRSTEVLSVFATNAVPATVAATEPRSLELGMRFSSSVAGSVIGLRFYKGPGNTGTHVGNLWTTGGSKLASVTFVDESTSGWQTALFAAPVSIAANTEHLVSYHAPNGRYAVDTATFGAGAVVNGPLIAPATTPGGPNGIYTYSAVSTFPSTASANGSNYWVDVLFRPAAPLARAAAALRSTSTTPPPARTDADQRTSSTRPSAPPPATGGIDQLAPTDSGPHGSSEGNTSWTPSA